MCHIFFFSLVEVAAENTQAYNNTYFIINNDVIKKWIFYPRKQNS